MSNNICFWSDKIMTFLYFHTLIFKCHLQWSDVIYSVCPLRVERVEEESVGHLPDDMSLGTLTICTPYSRQRLQRAKGRLLVPCTHTARVSSRTVECHCVPSAMTHLASDPHANLLFSSQLTLSVTGQLLWTCNHPQWSSVPAYDTSLYSPLPVITHP